MQSALSGAKMSARDRRRAAQQQRLLAIQEAQQEMSAYRPDDLGDQDD